MQMFRCTCKYLYIYILYPIYTVYIYYIYISNIYIYTIINIYISYYCIYIYIYTLFLLGLLGLACGVRAIPARSLLDWLVIRHELLAVINTGGSRCQFKGQRWELFCACWGPMLLESKLDAVPKWFRKTAIHTWRILLCGRSSKAAIFSASNELDDRLHRVVLLVGCEGLGNDHVCVQQRSGFHAQCSMLPLLERVLPERHVSSAQQLNDGRSPDWWSLNLEWWRWMLQGHRSPSNRNTGTEL